MKERDIILAAADWMENLALKDYYGYAWGGWGPRDYDCGHAIITAWEESGVRVKTHGAASTHNMFQVFTSLGFRDVIGSVNLSTGAGMERGDVLLHETDHAAMYCGDGELVHARSSEGNNIPGDQNGQEIRIQAYFNWPNGGWQHVLRYMGGDTEEQTPGVFCGNEENCLSLFEKSSFVLQRGDGMTQTDPDVMKILRRLVRALQCLLNAQALMDGRPVCDETELLDEDGEFGILTEKAVIEFERRNGIEPKGIIYGFVWHALNDFNLKG